MSTHPDILDRRESLRGPFWGSLAFHLSLAGIAAGYAWTGPKRIQWGDPSGGGLGSVAVNPVASIPLPSRSGPTNPVANDTESLVPAPPPKAKPQPKAKAVEPDAISLKSKNAKKREDRAAVWSPPNKYAEKNPPRENQLTSTAGQRMNSEFIGKAGGGEGIGITDSPFGTQFGEYAGRLRSQVARNWNKTGLDRVGSTPIAAIVFTVRRDGSLVTESVKVSRSSGNRALDLSAQRAVMDAAPFPPLPPQYKGSDVTLELEFQLRL
jgi:periplasmic protein TonB